MGNDLLAGTGTERPRGLELDDLAHRTQACAARMEEVLHRCNEIQLLNWQSPAGNAYRSRVAEHAEALRSALDRLGEAGLAIRYRAMEAAESRAASSLPWP